MHFVFLFMSLAHLEAIFVRSASGFSFFSSDRCLLVPTLFVLKEYFSGPVLWQSGRNLRLSRKKKFLSLTGHWCLRVNAVGGTSITFVTDFYLLFLSLLPIFILGSFSAS